MYYIYTETIWRIWNLCESLTIIGIIQAILFNRVKYVSTIEKKTQKNSKISHAY